MATVGGGGARSWLLQQAEEALGRGCRGRRRKLAAAAARWAEGRAWYPTARPAAGERQLARAGAGWGSSNGERRRSSVAGAASGDVGEPRTEANEQ